MQGAAISIVSLAEAEKVARSINHARVHSFDGLGHVGVLSAKYQQIVDITLQWVAEHNDLAQLSVKQLKSICRRCSLSTVGAAERSDFVELIQSYFDQIRGPTRSTSFS